MCRVHSLLGRRACRQLRTFHAGQRQNDTFRIFLMKSSRRVQRYALGIGLLSFALLGIVSSNSVEPFSTSSSDGTRPEKTSSGREKDGENVSPNPSFHTASVPTNKITTSISSWTWPSLPDFPDISKMKDKISVLLLELGRDPGSLYDQVVNQSPDPLIHPECEWDAEVRLGEELCIMERAFLRERKRNMRIPFAEFIGVSPDEIHEDDIPIVAIAGSGGGYRAMLNTTGSLIGAKISGFLDSATYITGISGSCWALGVIYSGVSGSVDPFSAGQHLKNRIKLSYIDIATLEALTTPPTNEYLLSGILRKASGPGGTASLVDLYGTMLASRLFVPNDLTKVDARQLSLYQFGKSIEGGNMPLPIFTALHHVISPTKLGHLKANAKTQDVSIDDAQRERAQAQQNHIENEHSRWLWYEFTPYEVGCDELGAWIPAWAFGRQFMHGKSLDRRPELSFTILTGIFGSAFCASLKYYFLETKPMLRALPFQLYNWLEELITENYEKDMGVIHPVLPNEVPNFVKGLTGQLRRGSPSGITEQDNLGLMDAGAELNIPYYPLLRRNIDCIIALDASADSQDLWFKRAEELAVKRGLHTWPRGAGWPVQVSKTKQDGSNLTRQASAVDNTAESANLELAKQQETEVTFQTGKQLDDEQRDFTSQDLTKIPREMHDLSSCEIWIGSSSADTKTPSRVENTDIEALSQRDGIAIVYMPLVPNEKKVPGYDPTTLSTWKREIDPDESQKLLDVAQANFIDGVPKLRKLLHAIWLRKKHDREARDEQIMINDLQIYRTFHD